MSEARSTSVDLEALALRSGEAATLELLLRPAPPVVGGERLEMDSDRLDARVDVSRTSSGFALRLRAETRLTGTCARCLGLADHPVRLDAREVEQASSDDEELRSPYVADGVLDADAWAHDALRLTLPERLLCGEDCAGLCEHCGASLNDADPAEHRHERPPDPRFAKLRQLTEGS